MPTSDPARLLIVERQPVVTPEVRTRLGREPGFAVLGRVGSAVEATRLVRRALAGEFPIDEEVVRHPAVAARILARFRQAESAAPAQPAPTALEPAADAEPLGPLFVKLSPREIEILDQVARGNSTKLIARKLGISDQTVKNHVSAILRKLEVNDRTEAVVYALRNGWIRIDTPVS